METRFTGATAIFFLNQYATLLKTIVGLSVKWATSVHVRTVCGCCAQTS